MDPDATRYEGQPRRRGMQGEAQISPVPQRSAGKIACGLAQRGCEIESRGKEGMGRVEVVSKFLTNHGPREE